MLDIKEINALDKKIINELEQKNMTNQTHRQHNKLKIGCFL